MLVELGYDDGLAAEVVNLVSSVVSTNNICF
jgi:hypothetical protein